MEWLSHIFDGPIYKLLETFGVVALGRWAFLEFIKEKAHVKLHQKNAAKIDWLIESVGHLAHAQGVDLQPYVPVEDLVALKALLQPRKELWTKQPNHESTNSSLPCSH